MKVKEFVSHFFQTFLYKYYILPFEKHEGYNNCRLKTRKHGGCLLKLCVWEINLARPIFVDIERAFKNYIQNNPEKNLSELKFGKFGIVRSSIIFKIALLFSARSCYRTES